MLSPKKILYIQNYDFGEEYNERNKFLIILHQIDESCLLISLTTSKDHIPERLIETGRICLREEENNIHSYMFPEGKIIGQNGFSFPRNTFIDINKSQVFQREKKYFAEKYIQTELAKEQDSLTDSEYHDLLYCISKARHIPLGIKRQIETVLASYYSNK